MGLQLADKVTALDGFQATVDTAGHREAAESIHSLVLLSASSPYVGCVLRFTLISENFWNLKRIEKKYNETSHYSGIKDFFMH